MDLFQIISDIEKVDPEVYERFDTRRRVFKHMSGLGKKLSAAAVPGMLSAMFNKAYGQAAPSDVAATLNLALSLEYLERYYYQAGIDRGLFSGGDLTAITIIRDDELGHIAALRGIQLTGYTPIADPTAAAFDYTAGGKLTPFTSAANFLGTAQAFVDTGVRAYKGGAASLINNKDILTAALNIHSVEARHSSHIRTMRRNGTGAVGQVAGGAGNTTPKSWVSLQENGGPVPAVTAPVYAAGTDATKFPAEDNVTQSTFNAQTGSPAPAGLTVSADAARAAATEAFDEPLDAAAVKTIARNFRSAAGITLGLFA